MRETERNRKVRRDEREKKKRERHTFALTFPGQSKVYTHTHTSTHTQHANEKSARKYCFCQVKKGIKVDKFEGINYLLISGIKE